MAARALIIAIEEYPQIEEFEKTLPGTRASASTFRDWFVQARGIKPEDEEGRIFVCSDGPMDGKTHGATAQDIRHALSELARVGAGQTEELFVYFSGHGFLFREGAGRRAADVLVAGDFGRKEVDGALCMKLSSIQDELRRAMGPGNHYYFVDACRNEISDEEIDVGSLGVRLRQLNQRQALLFTLFSTTRLSTAPAASAFTDFVVSGLQGKGKAKRPVGGVPPRMRVVWASLEEYVKTKMPEADGLHDGSGPAVLWEDLLTQNTCTITIDNASAADSFDVTPTNSLGQALASFAIHGSTGVFKQAPDDYFLAVAHQLRHPVVAIDPIPPNPVELYDNTTARFELEAAATRGFGGGGGGGWSNAVGPLPPLRPPSLTVIGPEGSTIAVRDAASGHVESGAVQISLPVKPGTPLIVDVVDREGTLIARRDITLRPGDDETIDLRFPDTPLRNAIAAAVPSSKDEGWVDFSESLGGPITDPDLGLWLSIIAASRVLGYSDFSKLGPLPLQTFQNIVPGSSALYVLAGFDDGDQPFRVGFGTTAANHTWQVPNAVHGFPGLFELVAQPQRGGLLVSFAFGDEAPHTISSYALANRATVVAVTRRTNQFAIHQLLLPIRSLAAQLDAEVRDRLPSNPLRAVKFVAQAQRLLARRRSLVESTGGSPEWNETLAGKWLDPMMAIVTCYEMIRQGQAEQIDLALDNLTRYFGELPDTAALKQLRSPREDVPPPHWPPLVIDGVDAFPEGAFDILPRGKLVATGLWTMWRSAVARPQ